MNVIVDVIADVVVVVILVVVVVVVVVRRLTDARVTSKLCFDQPECFSIVT